MRIGLPKLGFKPVEVRVTFSYHLKLKKYKCSECAYKTSSRPRLQVHVEKTHKPAITTTCKYCDYSTKSVYRDILMKNHVKAIHKVQQ